MAGLERFWKGFGKDFYTDISGRVKWVMWLMGGNVRVLDSFVREMVRLLYVLC